MSPYRELKEAAWRCNMELPKLGLAIHTFGNASAVDRAAGSSRSSPAAFPTAS